MFNKQNLIEHVWQWDPKTSFFFDDDGNVMARMNPDDLSVQLADLAVIGNVELAGGQRTLRFLSFDKGAANALVCSRRVCAQDPAQLFGSSGPQGSL